MSTKLICMSNDRGLRVLHKTGSSKQKSTSNRHVNDSTAVPSLHSGVNYLSKPPFVAPPDASDAGPLNAPPVNHADHERTDAANSQNQLWSEREVRPMLPDIRGSQHIIARFVTSRSKLRNRENFELTAQRIPDVLVPAFCWQALLLSSVNLARTSKTSSIAPFVVGDRARFAQKHPEADPKGRSISGSEEVFSPAERLPRDKYRDILGTPFRIPETGTLCWSTI
ncbi:hypothetical protein ACOME3_008201 [Neoechinorhynchus agilis]